MNPEFDYADLTEDDYAVNEELEWEDL